MLQTTAVIIGAGPAGAATSIFLTKAGIPHIILEKETFPRDKVCGDGCSGKSVFVLRKADPAWLDELLIGPAAFTSSYGISFFAPNANRMDVPMGPGYRPGEKAPGFTAPRLHFDNFLFGKLPSPYATIYQDVAVQQITRLANGEMQVTAMHEGKQLEINAKLVVGADGDKGIVRKTLLQEHTSPKTHAVGLRAYYEGVTDMHGENFLELHFMPEMLPGYFWIFPLPNGQMNVGIGIPADVVRHKKLNIRQMMLDVIENNPNIRQRFANAKLQGKIQGWGLPMATEKLPVSGAGFLLTGDAASLIDPFTGEGIGNALYSGMLAAEAIQKAVTADDYSAEFIRQAYDNELYRRVWDELRISTVLQRLCRYPWLFNFVVNKARKSPSLQQTISGMFANLDLRDQLRKPSFYLKILMNK